MTPAPTKPEREGERVEGEPEPTLGEPGCTTKLSLNDTIPKYTQTLPSIHDLTLKMQLSVHAAGSDVKKFFHQIRQSPRTALLNTMMFYRDNVTGFPSIKMFDDNGKPNEKRILILERCYFGLSDLSQAAKQLDSSKNILKIGWHKYKN